MARGRSLAMFLTLSLLAHAFCVPTGGLRQRRGLADNKLDSKEISTAAAAASKSKEVSEQSSPDSKPSSATPTSIDADKSVEDDDDDDFDTQSSPPSSGGSNIFSLLNLATALFPASGSGGNNSSHSSQSSTSPLWTLKMDVLRALLQFGTSMLGLASSSFSNASV
ncbi:uncharacterized protein LOC110370908 [Helicoverpa armigera]|uniref:uncharacterized protein LOC110370908 n=1 Tax=Helicoverpa armigera TaxID=29058 RepID=UPI003083CB66